jgi:lysophospholipase L1-like esterase
VQRTPPEPFGDFPSTAYFWDTVGYVGILPWLAVLGLLIALFLRRRRPGRRAAFFATLGAASLVLALPFAKELGSLLPGTFLRSPARLLYVIAFVLSLAAGAALDISLRSVRRRGARQRAVLAGVAVLVHVVDLTAHDRAFIRVRPRALQAMPSAESLLAERLGSGRVAIDYPITLAMNRRFDDVGFFDSILLARPYRALLELSGISTDVNVQDLSGSALPVRALSNLGVHYVITAGSRSDLPLVFSERYPLYAVPDPLPRVAFFPPERVRFMSEDDMHPRLQQSWFRLSGGLMLPLETGGPDEAGGAARSPEAGLEARIEYGRPSPDRIELRVDAPRAGFIRILESWDPGWKASIDGIPVPVLRADTFAVALAVGPGGHRVELEFDTPGARAGAAASLASALLLSALLWGSRRRAHPAVPRRRDPPRARRSGPKRLPEIALALGATAFTLASLELVGRLVFEPIPENILHGLSPGDIPDDHLLWRNRPGYPFDDFDGPIDSHGFRGREVFLAQPSRGVRILSVGESTTFGHGVQAGETYSAILERLLRQRGFEGAQVLNAGVRAWSTYQVFRYLEAEIAEIQPDLVLVYNEINDFLPTTFRVLDIPGAGLTDIEAISLAERRAWIHRLTRHSRFITGLRLWRMRRGTTEALRLRAEDSGTDVLSVVQLPFERIPPMSPGGELPWMSNDNPLVRLPDPERGETLRALIELVRSHGARLVVIHPAYRASRPHRCLLTQTAAEAGIPVFEAQDALMASARERRIQFLDYFQPNDVFHPNAAGHAALAEELSRFLVENALLPEPAGVAAAVPRGGDRGERNYTD